MNAYGFCRSRSLYVFNAITLLLMLAPASFGQGNVFSHIRYNGGTFYTKVSPKEWDNQLTVTSDVITFKLKDDQEIQILSKLVTSLSYGQEAHRRVGAVLGVAIAPLRVLGVHRESHLYFIGMQYSSPKGEKAGLLLQGDKDNYRAILQALQSVTNLPIAIGEGDREDVPVGLRTTLDASREGSATGKSAAPSGPEAAQYGNLVITSDPQGADVFVDGIFIGDTPATLDLMVGNHTVRVSYQGYADWSRQIAILLRSKLTLAATLDKK